ncbi:MAG: PorT family protein, partial [Tannerellaceae bacterium]|nr:PorT family protein [Tannerellaceae bacterium]
IDLRSGKSLEYNINFYEKAFPFSVYNWAFVTGAGIRWSRYRLNGNVHLEEIDRVTQLVPAPDGIHYKASKLNITSLTIPALFEWQKSHHGDTKYFFSAGAVGVVKTMSSSKIVYRDENGKKRKDKVDGGMNIHPVTVDFLFQAGLSWLGVYAKYSPMELFGSDRGPAVHPVSLGLHIHF